LPNSLNKTLQKIKYFLQINFNFTLLFKSYQIIMITQLTTVKTIGIIGGGQLGKMTNHAAQQLGFNTIVFSDQESCGSKSSANSIIAPYNNEEALSKFANLADVATFEFENIPLATAKFLEGRMPIFPNSNALAIAQNRQLEKAFLANNNIQTVDFAPINSLEELKAKSVEFLGKYQKIVIKTAVFGYDGKGQFVLDRLKIGNNPTNKIIEIWQELAQHYQKVPPLIIEEFWQFDYEISVITARSNKEIRAFMPMLNIHKNGILATSIYPSKASEDIIAKAIDITNRLAIALDIFGLLTVEFFVGTRNNETTIVVNEIAPRPHNSGHFSMDGANISQFEQLVRAIANLPLISPNFLFSGRMINLIGEEALEVEQYLKSNNSRIHLYGKEIAPNRKMGHINILAT